MWKILIFLTIVVCAQCTGGSSVKRTTRRESIISTTTTRATKPESTTTTIKLPTTTSAETTSRIWRSTDKHRHHHGMNSSGADYDSPSPTSTKTPLKTLQKEQKDLITQAEEEATKRTSRLVTIEREPENLKKSIEIELKSFTPPPDEPAIIEVLPESAISYQNPLPNSWYYSYPHTVEERQWPGLPYNPSERSAYGQVDWNSYNNPYQYRIIHVPTEELIHGQSYKNNYEVNPFIYYSQPQPSLQPQADQPRSARYDPYVLKDMILKKSQALPGQDLALKRDAEYTDPITNTEATSSTQDDHHTEVNNKNNFQWVAYPPELAKTISINTGPALEYKPIVTKFVTRSYKLKTYPKLEWVPL